MKLYTIKITKKDLLYIDDAMEAISDYPLYGSTSNISRSQALLIAKILELPLENNTEIEANIEIT